MRPLILVVERDDAAREVLADELDARYARHYDVAVVATNDAAIGRLERAESGDVALVLADREHGVPVLIATRAHHPHAKRALLIGWNEQRSAREEIVDLLSRGAADYFITRPTVVPDERFHRAICEFLDEWWKLRDRPSDAVQIIGDERSPWIHDTLDLLARHDFPYVFHDRESDAGRAVLEQLDLASAPSCVVLIEGAAPLIDPSDLEIAQALGARTQPGTGTYDVVVIGGGPAGLAAAVTAGSEGLRVALVERTSMGGQAGTSSMIRNYLGFPRGVSGAELAARAFDQAVLFGTEMVYGGDVSNIRVDGDLRIVELADGRTIPARAVVIATGVAYRQLAVPALEALHGIGVHYGSVLSEARTLDGAHACVVGGGNSAGQAALHLSQFAASVTIVVRSQSLAASMSDYLIRSIERTPNITIRYCIEIVDGGGDGHLEWIEMRDTSTGATERLPTAALFVLIGADPCTEWLPPTIERDAWGYISTGGHCQCSFPADGGRAPMMFETTMPGVFAVGDVRQGAAKRVASATGEGAVCVRVLHDYLDAVPVPV
jgi:thioredoxin reductase (NADPH)